MSYIAGFKVEGCVKSGVLREGVGHVVRVSDR